jgi:hypothetical protein
VHLPDHRLPGLLAVVDAAARQRPVARVRAADRVAGEQHLRAEPSLPLDQGVRRHALHLERLVLGQDLGHQADDRDGAVEHAGHRLPGGVHRRAVHLDDVRLGAVDRDPAVVHDAQGVRVRPPALSPAVALVEGVDVGGLPDVHVEPGLLVDLSDDGVARVLTVLEAAPGQRPQLLAGQPLGEPAQEDLGARARRDTHDDGVRGHTLHLPHLPPLRHP